jgi:hypothetical protein
MLYFLVFSLLALSKNFSPIKRKDEKYKSYLLDLNSLNLMPKIIKCKPKVNSPFTTDYNFNKKTKKKMTLKAEIMPLLTHKTDPLIFKKKTLTLPPLEKTLFLEKWIKKMPLDTKVIDSFRFF